MDLSSEVYLSKPVVECKTEDGAVKTEALPTDVDNVCSSQSTGTNGTDGYPTVDPSKPPDQQVMYHHTGYDQMQHYGAAPTAEAYIAAGYDPTTAAYASQGWMYSALVGPNLSANSTTESAAATQNGYVGVKIQYFHSP